MAYTDSKLALINRNPCIALHLSGQETNNYSDGIVALWFLELAKDFS
jgi:hypothetical protein